MHSHDEIQQQLGNIIYVIRVSTIASAQIHAAMMDHVVDLNFKNTFFRRYLFYNVKHLAGGLYVFTIKHEILNWKRGIGGILLDSWSCCLASPVVKNVSLSWRVLLPDTLMLIRVEI